MIIMIEEIQNCQLCQQIENICGSEFFYGRMGPFLNWTGWISLLFNVSIFFTKKVTT